MPEATEGFTSYARIADALIDKASKKELADVARRLPLNIGHYYERYDDVPQDILLKSGATAIPM